MPEGCGHGITGYCTRCNEEALANQRRRMGAENDELRAELERVRAMVRPTLEAALVLAEFAKTAPGRLPQRVQDAIAATGVWGTP